MIGPVAASLAVFSALHVSGAISSGDPVGLVYHCTALPILLAALFLLSGHRALRRWR